MQSIVTTRDTATLTTIRKRQEAFIFAVILLAALSVVPLVILGGATNGFTLTFGALVALVVAAVVIRWPIAGLFLALAGAVLVEQTSLTTYIITDQLYVFYWPKSLEGLFERPVGFLFLLTLAVLVCSRLITRQQPLTGGKLIVPFSTYRLCVAAEVVHGLLTGGSLKIIVVEIRPFWYMFISYLLSYNLVTLKKHVRAFFWVVIVGAGIKGLQGVYIYLVYFHGDLQGRDTLMSHEESFFFAALILLLVLFCIHCRYRPQLYAALLVLPPVLIAFVANQRRTDYIALVVGIAVAWCILFTLKPRARRKMVVLMLLCVIFAAGYVAAFSRSSVWYAEPARAIVSVVNPSADDSRNVNSNLYRTVENYDLQYTAKRNPLGLGFGKPYLQPLQLTIVFPQILAFDPYYNYVPHNNIYWLWVRLGIIGYAAFWYLLGSVIVQGCLIARRLKDQYLQLTAIFIVAVTFMEVIAAFADYQLFFYRNVIYVGLLFGILMRLPMIDKAAEAKKEAGRP